MRTPALLELSGIGDAVRLKSFGITPLLDLPGVGENLQNHLYTPIQYRLNPKIKTRGESEWPRRVLLSVLIHRSLSERS